MDMEYPAPSAPVSPCFQFLTAVPFKLFLPSYLFMPFYAFFFFSTVSDFGCSLLPFLFFH